MGFKLRLPQEEVNEVGPETVKFFDCSWMSGLDAQPKEASDAAAGSKGKLAVAVSSAGGVVSWEATIVVKVPMVPVGAPSN